MSFRLETMISLLRRRRPSYYDALRRLDHAAYESLTPWNFSRDFLADIPDALVVLQVEDIGWSDWGTPEAVERTLLSLSLVPPWHARPPAAVSMPLTTMDIEIQTATLHRARRSCAPAAVGFARPRGSPHRFR